MNLRIINFLLENYSIYNKKICFFMLSDAEVANNEKFYYVRNHKSQYLMFSNKDEEIVFQLAGLTIRS